MATGGKAINPIASISPVLDSKRQEYLNQIAGPQDDAAPLDDIVHPGGRDGFLADLERVSAPAIDPASIRRPLAPRPYRSKLTAEERSAIGRANSAKRKATKPADNPLPPQAAPVMAAGRRYSEDPETTAAFERLRRLNAETPARERATAHEYTPWRGMMAELYNRARLDPDGFADSVVGLSEDKKTLLAEMAVLRSERDRYLALLTAMGRQQAVFSAAVNQEPWDDIAAEKATERTFELLERVPFVLHGEDVAAAPTGKKGKDG